MPIFFQAFWYLVHLFFWPLITQWASVQSPFEQRARDCLRYLYTCSNTWAKTCLYKIHCSSSEWIDTPQFFSYFDRLWVGDMISCFIWPSINSWRHHNGLRTQNFNLHIMTSAYFWKIDCISVNIDHFLSNFDMFYLRQFSTNTVTTYISFWQRHHGVFLRLKEACQFFTFCVYSLWDMTFSQNWILHSRLSRTISPSFYLCLRWALSML